MVDKEPDFQPSEERNEWDMERIHELAERLLPIYADIATGQTQEPKTQRYLNELIGILHDLHPADMATVLESLPQQERVMVWKLSEPDEDGEVLLEVSDAVRETLIESMGQRELLAAIEDLDADELAELAPDLPKEVVHEALESLDAEERAQVVSALSYEEDEVGALMDFEMVSIRADVTCEVVLRYLRRFESLPDHTDKIFVVDDDDVLQGV